MNNVRLLWIVLLVGVVPDAAAQPAEPIGPFVIDARGTLAPVKGDAAVADALGVAADDLPTRGLGISAGAHWYPLRRGRVTFGLGGELVVARDRQGAEATDASGPTPTPVAAPVVTTTLSGFSPQVSLNFGSQDGWSYISGGIGRARLASAREGGSGGSPVSGVEPERVSAINYGGGARWFTSPRLAFSVDVRFYMIGGQGTPRVAGTRIGHPRSRFMAFSVGASIR